LFFASLRFLLVFKAIFKAFKANGPPLKPDKVRKMNKYAKEGKMSQSSIHGVVLATIAALLIAAACFSGPSPLGKSISRQIGKMQKHKAKKIKSEASQFRKRIALNKNYKLSSLAWGATNI
jgi:hypothetical protein